MGPTRLSQTAAAKQATAATSDKVVASSEVGYFEADPPATRNRKTVDGRRIPKKVEVKGYSFQGVFPEQATWHVERKQQILKAHPEIEKLYGNNPWSAALLLFSFSSITALAVYMADVSWPVFLVASYSIGALLSWQCATMSHEGTHKLVFKTAYLNKLLACLAMLPVLLGPFGNYWAVEHMYHHQIVIDKMNRYGSQQSTPIRKALGALLFFPIANLLFFVVSMIVYTRTLASLALYTIGLKETAYPTEVRLPPYKNFPQIINKWYVINTTLAILYNTALVATAGYKPVLFLYLSSGFANGLHPLGMRQVQEHYLQKKGQPTYSVYSVFNPILFNLGFHVEHHDFPQIPFNRLPQVRKIAPEFYNNLMYYNSYTEVLQKFLFTPGIPITSLIEEYEELIPGFK